MNAGGYGTPHEIAIAAITAKHRRGRRVFCVAGGRRWTTSIETSHTRPCKRARLPAKQDLLSRAARA